MIREIKFRVWCKEYEQFIQFNKMRFLEDGSLWYVQGVDGNEKEINPPYFENQNDWELMQYTGLKDAKGVEIYEGDIVVWEYSGKPQEVFWDNSICGFSTKHYHLWRTVKKLKVIGNIYQNPELLEVAE